MSDTALSRSRRTFEKNHYNIKDALKNYWALKNHEDVSEGSSLMNSGIGHGKTILFGEHFVVYGLPAIASAIGLKTIASVKKMKTPGWHVIDKRPAPSSQGKGMIEQAKSIERILKHLDFDPEKKGVEIRFWGDLEIASGLGASAASCVAFTRALNKEFKLGLTEEDVNSAAFEGEKEYHGNPSGIDNTVATYKGLIWFKRNLKGGSNIVEKLKSGSPIELVIGNTGVTASTGQVINRVRRRREQQPNRFKIIFKEYNNIAVKARKALYKGDLKEIGSLMNENQELLRLIGVSSTILEELISSALDIGAYGAKLTGKGRGGSMIALTPGLDLQEKVYRVFSKGGFKAWKTTIRE